MIGGSVAGAEFAAEAFAHEGAGVVEADDLHVFAVVVVFLGDGVQRGDGGGVPEVGGVHVDDDVFGVQGVFELGVEVVGGGEEQFAVDHVRGRFVAVDGLDGPFDGDEVRHAAGEHDHGHEHADDRRRWRGCGWRR